MLIESVSFDGAVFSVSSPEALSLKAACLAAAEGDASYIDFTTTEGHRVSVLFRPGSRIHFTSVDTASEVVPISDHADFAAASGDDEFDLTWFDYVA
jgi:hypothetical protein